MAGFQDVFGDVRLPKFQSVSIHLERYMKIVTHKWHAAVRAPADLRLVGVDEDARVSQWPSTAIT